MPGGDVNGINGLLDIDAGGAADRLVVDDSGETADDIGRVTSNEISGLGMTVDPTHTPADAVHVITVREAEDGTFTITVGGHTTAPIAFDAKQDVVRNAIVAALGVAVADVSVTRVACAAPPAESPTASRSSVRWPARPGTTSAA